jgi:hypothetical protein
MLASAQSVPPIAPGATFKDVPDLGVTGRHTYLYTPAVLNSPAPMLTPVSTLGPVARAEADRAAIILAVGSRSTP